jgi:succinate dehydrogenase/fumarate reductase flavoprotein subunit
VEWIEKAADVLLPDVGPMGGHSMARTHRPRGRLSGAAFISGLEKAANRYVKTGQLTLHKSTKLEALLPGPNATDDAGATVRAGWNLNLKDVKSGVEFTVSAQSVILATGGYSSDRADGGLISQIAPHLLKIASTNGAFATGDGIKIARTLGAKTVDMDIIQVHALGGGPLNTVGH